MVRNYKLQLYFRDLLLKMINHDHQTRNTQMYREPKCDVQYTSFKNKKVKTHNKLQTIINLHSNTNWTTGITGELLNCNVDEQRAQ